VTIDRFNGNPLSVVVDGHTFTFITEIFNSPFLFSRGTRVFVVQDENEHYHILKDSWILVSHNVSEIENLKIISEKAQEEDVDPRLRALLPRFIAGDDNVDQTSRNRDMLPVGHTHRQRRRIVTGPIGDPITSYCSRIECLQAFVDIADHLKFLDEKCDLVHSDISLTNVMIVRFPGVSSKLSTNPSMLPTENKLVPWDNVVPCGRDGLESHEVLSGGGILDFDYTHASNTESTKQSGTLPYMAVSLLNHKMRQAPLIHRLAHDLESLCMVLIHIVRFSCGPIGTNKGKINRKTYRVSQWHHESDMQALEDYKKMDLKEIAENPELYVNGYWAPIASFIGKLL
ncbi:hypothetical protein HYPSUDRAFT_122095, partial [Hypholoma sublateritium FD-334 SS-4]